MNAIIHPYGAAVGAAALLAALLMLHQQRRFGLKRETASWMLLFSLPLGVLCARLGYCLSRLSWFADKGIGWFFRFTEGGYMLPGAVGGILLAGWLTARVTRQRTAQVWDAAAAPGLLALTLARLAEGLTGQGTGWPIADWFSVDAFDAEEYTGMSLFHLEDAGLFERFPFAVQDSFYGEWHWAVFVIEALLTLLILVLVLRTSAKRSGSVALKAGALLSAVTVLGESLRQDEVLRLGVVRVSQVLGAVILAVILLLCCTRLSAPRPRKQVVLSWVSLLAAMGLVMAMEFALEKKIVFLEFLPMDVCYLIMSLGCIWLWLAIRPLWRRQDAQA